MWRTDRPAQLPWRNSLADREATEANRRRETAQGQNAPQKLVVVLVIVAFEMSDHLSCYAVT